VNRQTQGSDVIVRVEPDHFVAIVKRQSEALVVHATGGSFNTDYRSLTSYNGLAVYTEAAPLAVELAAPVHPFG